MKLTHSNILRGHRSFERWSSSHGWATCSIGPGRRSLSSSSQSARLYFNTTAGPALRRDGAATHWNGAAGQSSCRSWLSSEAVPLSPGWLVGLAAMFLVGVDERLV